jgi:hypothetical protein
MIGLFLRSYGVKTVMVLRSVKIELPRDFIFRAL